MLCGFLGVCVGAVMFFLLTRFTAAVTGAASGKGISPAALIFGILQLFIPVGFLLAVAVIRSSELIYAGSGMAASLIFGAVIKFFFDNKRKRK